MKLKDKPWINSKIQKMMRIRNRVLQKWKKQQTDDNLKLYKKFRNRVSNELKESKARYFHNYFSTNSNNMKKLWSGIKSIIPHKSSTSSVVNKLKDKDGNVTSDPCKVTNIFNDFFVTINGTEVSSSEVYEYLGVSVDRSLSFSDHFNKVYRKAVNRVHLLQRMRQKLTTQTAEAIYKSMIRPLITYSDLVLLCLSNSNIKKLERLQDRAENCVFGKSTSSYWPSLQSERQRKAAVFTYKCVNGLTPPIFKDYFTKISHGKGTRGDAVNLKIPNAKLEAYRRSIQFQGAVIFNKLPMELKTETSLLRFKIKLGGHFNL